MLIRIVIDIDVSKPAADQMHRAGFEVVREGDRHTVRLPNRIIRSANCQVRFEDVKPATPEE